jgi:GT2 family glycosyltransferase
VRASRESTAESVEVSIAIVTRNSAADLEACYQSLAGLTGVAFEIVVVDCASEDGSAEIARRCAPPGIRTIVHSSADNLGFSGGMNAAIRASRSPYLLSLNADTRPEPDFLSQLVACLRAGRSTKAGAATGRLIRFPEPGLPTRLDACGMRLTPTWRHLDRGSGRIDRGQWLRIEEVFGATGAATLFLREALEDVAIDGEVFLEEFHSYREDAELCFRLRERGWRVIYEPAASCFHRRVVVPASRKTADEAINRHSLKNRYLLRAYHQTLTNLGWTLVPALGRDLAALAYVLLFERTSLGAYRWLWHNRARILRRRQSIQNRRTELSRSLDMWFLRASRPWKPA